MARKLTDIQKSYIAALKAAETEADKTTVLSDLVAETHLPIGTIRGLLNAGHITQDMADTIMGGKKPVDVKPAPIGKKPKPACAKRRLHIHKLLGGAG